MTKQVRRRMMAELAASNGGEIKVLGSWGTVNGKQKTGSTLVCGGHVRLGVDHVRTCQGTLGQPCYVTADG